MTRDPVARDQAYLAAVAIEREAEDRERAIGNRRRLTHHSGWTPELRARHRAARAAYNRCNGTHDSEGQFGRGLAA